MSREKSLQHAVGIDLGTTYSVVATLDAQGRPVTIQNAEGDVTTPSVVMFDRSSVIVGKEAVKLASFEPDAVAAYAKRDIGASHFGKTIRGQHFPPEVVQSFVLAKLRSDAELKLGAVRKAVVTVPAYFNEPRRKATQDAARLAGLELLDIINEPTAAAIAYGVEQRFLSADQGTAEPETVLVYDLGGGTFDVTVMRLEGHDYTALATAGDVYLGGIDWDRRILDHFAERFSEEHGGLDPREDPSALVRLMREAEEAKRALTAREDVMMTFEHEGRLLKVTLKRGEFEMLTADLLERTRFTTRSLLKDAGLNWDDISRLLLVGGSSRMPMVQTMLEDETGIVPDRSLAADEAVAHGAAIFAGYLLAGKSGTVRAKTVGTITNVSSHDLGVLGTEPATGRPRRKILIPRNTPLPAKRGGRFATERDNQRMVVVKVVEGGDASGHNATAVGTCKVTDLPADLPAHTPVDVIFAYQQNGRLVVRARLPSVDRDATLTIERESGLTEAQLEEWAQRIEEGRLLVEPGESQEDEVFEAVFDDGGTDETFVADEAPSEAAAELEDVIVDLGADDVDVSDPVIKIKGRQPPADVSGDDQGLGDFLKELPP